MKRACLAVLGGVAALGVCGPASASNPVAQAAAAPTGPTSVTVTVSIHSSSASDTLQGSGTFNAGSRDGVVHFEMVAAPAPHNLKPVRSSWAAITSGDSTWLPENIGHGFTWLRFNRAWGLQQAGVDLGSVVGETPADLLAELRGSTPISTVGKETVGGVATTHYRVALPATPATNALLNVWCTSFSPADVWVDGNGLVRQITIRCMASHGTPAQTERVSLTQTFAPGKLVKVTIPSAAKVLDANRYGGN